MKRATLLTAIFLTLSSCTPSAEGGITLLDGTPFVLDEAISGTPTILNFWASWCPFCTTELPAFQEVSQRYPEIQIFAINLQENADDAQKYWQDGGYTFTAILDPNAELKAKFDVFTQPTTIIFNARGEVVERRDGPLSAEEIENLAAKLASRQIMKDTMQPSEETTIKTSPTPTFLRSWYSTGKRSPDVQHTVPFEKILSGGVPKDGIPAIDNPQFVSVTEATKFLQPDDVGTIFMEGNTVRFYPFRILNWHEIINDTVEGKDIMITYCPLCDSAAVYARDISVGTPTFGVSGFLYQSNLVMYDRETESLWNQILGTAMIGELTGEELKLLPSNVIRFKTIQEHYSDAEVLSTETGYARDYKRDPYRGYAEKDDIIFPVGTIDYRLAAKDRVLGIVVDGTAKAYPRAVVEKKGTIKDLVGGVDVLVKWDADQERVTFSVNGTPVEPIHAFWFSWVAQHPETEVFTRNDQTSRATMTMEEGLQAFLDGTLEPEQLVITYSDLHGLWGGLEMTIDGSGKVEQKAAQIEAPSPQNLNEEEIRRLVEQLIELKAWEQRVPDRPPLPDESRVYLRIQAGQSKSDIWEWYNDLKKNDRLIRIVNAMKERAWGSR